MLDAALLSRIQFAFTISYHIIFPTLTIGMAVYLATMEGLWLKTGREIYLRQARFWQKPFAITFGMGVVSGVVLSYEFGTNFSRFSEIVGPVLSPLLSYEVLTAFFLEAGFLGIMLFGWKKVSPKVHFAATLIVAVGTLLSAFWILAANSWLHTPAGYTIVDGQFHPESWLEIIFNPSFPYRYFHMVFASLLSSSLLIAGVHAYYLMRGKHREFAKVGLSFAMWALMVLAPVQILVGDMHGLNVLEHQPVKLAAMEGIWETHSGVGLRLFAVPDQENATNHYEVVLPNVASLVLTHEADGEIQGLDAVPADERPPVAVVFYGFRLMVGLGLLMLALGALGAYARWKGRLYDHPLLLRFSVAMIPAGVIATLAGWYVVEVGRQPWLVQGLVRTMDVVSPLPAEQVATSLALFVVVYTLLFGTYIYFMRKLVRKGPDSGGAGEKNSVTSSEDLLPVTLNPDYHGREGESAEGISTALNKSGQEG
ncbi:cytochrome ubiquinol oxidase subunit I [Hahella sp. CCB-MM4]|uniref:cytochrome ubiquinol oxidase subunit I n=1 Tax=Hahella sp. (strain CCB-MM4) TaxID=1926491 RepID=UPI000B9C6491|nr:cytochrome ubiquinol oxidase subunit I [Hahella sp. CCB-MM4]